LDIITPWNRAHFPNIFLDLMGLLMVQGISKEEGCEDLALLILMSSKDNF